MELKRTSETAMINILVGIVTFIAAGFLLLWIFRPSSPKWLEQPRYTMLENNKRFKRAEEPSGPEY